MRVKINTVKYLKSNPDIILRKSKKGDLCTKSAKVLRMRVQGMTVQAIARYYQVSREEMNVFIESIAKEHLKRNDMPVR